MSATSRRGASIRPDLGHTTGLKALNPRLARDHIPGTSPGFRLCRGGKRCEIPFICSPLAATYWSQGAAAIKFAKDQLGGSLKRQEDRLSIYYDNPAGLEPMPILKELQQNRGIRFARAHSRGAAAWCRNERADPRHRATVSGPTSCSHTCSGGRLR